MKDLTTRSLLTLSALAFMASAPAAWAAAPSDTLVIGKSADPQTLDPGISIDNNDWTAIYPCYQRLVQYKNEGGKATSGVAGDLADSWTVSADGLTWDFKLKQGPSFADGSPVTAEAVKFSFERLFKLKQGPSEPFPADMTITAVDAKTVRFQLKTPFAPFLYILANDGASIINPKIIEHEKNGDLAQGWLSTHTAGSGAYQLSAWEKSQTLLLEPNPKYAGDKPSFAKVLIKIVPEASARRLQVEAGDIDIAEDLPPDQVAALAKTAKSSGVEVAEYPSLRVTYLYLNNKKAPLDNPDVRRALVQAVDASGIIDGILNGKAKPLGGPIPVGMWGHDDSLKPVTADAAKAKALLKKSGASVSSLTFLLSDRDPNWQPIALSVQANLADIGIKVDLQQMANSSMRDRIAKGDFDISIGNWSPDFSDPYMFMNYWFDSKNQGLPGNRSYYSNPKVDDLVRKAVTVSNQGERTKLYQDAQKLVVDEAAYVYLFQKDTEIVARSSVKGFIFNPMLENIYNVDHMTKSK